MDFFHLQPRVPVIRETGRLIVQSRLPQNFLIFQQATTQHKK